MGGYAAVAPIEQLLRPSVRRESYLKLCTLGEGGEGEGAGPSSGERTQHPPSLPSLLLSTFSSLPSSNSFPFSPPVLLRPSSGDPQGTEGLALSERPCWCPILTRSCESTHASSCTGSLARIHPHVIQLGSRKRTSPPPPRNDRPRKEGRTKAASPGVGLEQLHWHEPDARAVALVNQFTVFFPPTLPSTLLPEHVPNPDLMMIRVCVCMCGHVCVARRMPPSARRRRRRGGLMLISSKPTPALQYALLIFSCPTFGTKAGAQLKTPES